MDGDDISLPERFEKQINYLKQNPDIGIVGCNIVNKVLAKENTSLIEKSSTKQVEKPTIPEEPEWISLGTFVTSAYCGENYPHICNDGDSTYTATMTKPQQGRTIAVDPTVIPYGSEIKIICPEANIDGHIYIAEDCGNAIKGKRIDIFYNEHTVAYAHGMQEAEVFIKNPKYKGDTL